MAVARSIIMAHLVQFVAERKRIRFTAKGPAPRAKHKNTPVGTCKVVKNPKTGLKVELCKVKSSGKRQWKFRKLRKGR